MKSLPILPFSNRAQFRSWLKLNGQASEGIWLRIFKKDSEKKTVTYQEALEEALCYGWIDGQRKTYDKVSFLQKYTPRRKNSLWSKRNVDLVDGLIKSKKMRKEGLKEITQAQTDGRWQRAYESPKNMIIPQEAIDQIKSSPRAFAAFKRLGKQDLYYIYFQSATAKSEEVRIRRVKKIIEQLEQVTNQNPFRKG